LGKPFGGLVLGDGSGQCGLRSWLLEKNGSEEGKELTLP
jgi:hypothetical protein